MSSSEHARVRSVVSVLVIVSLMGLLVGCAESVVEDEAVSLLTSYIAAGDNAARYALLSVSTKARMTEAGFVSVGDDDDAGLLSTKATTVPGSVQVTVSTVDAPHALLYATWKETSSADSHEAWGYFTVEFTSQGPGVIWVADLLGKARTAYNEKRYEDAIEQYEAVLDLDPLNGMAYDGIGWCHLRTKALGDALDAFEKEKSLTPLASAPYNSLGAYYHTIKSRKKAYEAFETSMKVRPNAPAAGNLGKLAQLEQDLPRAKTWYLKMKELEPTRGWVYLQLASIAHVEGSHEECVEILDHNFKYLMDMELNFIGQYHRLYAQCVADSAPLSVDKTSVYAGWKALLKAKGILGSRPELDHLAARYKKLSGPVGLYLAPASGTSGGSSGGQPNEQGASSGEAPTDVAPPPKKLPFMK